MRLALFILLFFSCYVHFALGQGEGCESRRDEVKAGRRCRKPCSSDTDCKGVKTCQCDNICGMSCFNPDAPCPSLPVIPNGKIRYPGAKKYGTKAKYYCNASYQTIGRTSRKCRSDKKWSGKAPSCIRDRDTPQAEIACTVPKRRENAYPNTMETAFSPGQAVTYVCFTGYDSSGDANVYCRADGTWSRSNHFCGKVSCPIPEDPENGRVVGSDYSFAAAITYECNPGYEKVPPNRSPRRCGADREWTGTAQSCEIRRCNAPIAPPNGRVDDRGVDYVFRSRVRFVCNEGFRNTGSSFAVCNANAAWEGSAICHVHLDCDFENFHSPTCGYTSSPSEGWRRRYTRTDRNNRIGYVVYASAYTSEKSLLSPVIPQSGNDKCFNFFYKLDSANSHLVLKISRTIRWRDRVSHSIWVPGELTVKQNRVGRQVSFVATSGTVSLDDITVADEACSDECESNPCQNDGTCQDEVNGFTCTCTPDFGGTTCSEDLKCRECPERLSNAVVTITYQNPNKPYLLPGTKVTYACDRGFKIAGTTSKLKTVTCNSRRKWSANPDTIRCVVKKCPPIHHLQNGEMQPSLQTGVGHPMETSVAFTCWHGYRLEGANSIECLPTEKWSSSQPSCVEVKCKKIVVRNGHLVPFQHVYAINTVVRVECNNGYRLAGQGNVTCTITGTWFPQSLSCVPIPCSHLAAPAGGSITYQSESMVTFACDNTLRLVGARSVHCHLGKWSAKTPTCEVNSEIPAEPKPVVPIPQPPLQAMWNSWGEWSLWDPCTSTCGSGFQLRRRECPNSPPNTVMCRGKNVERKHCENEPCSPLSDPSSTFFYDGKEYLFFDEKKIQSQAKVHCKNYGASMVMIKTKDVFLAIGKHMDPTLKEFYWLGLELRYNHNTHRWTRYWLDNKVYKSENWRSRVVRRSTGYCTFMYTHNCGLIQNLPGDKWTKTQCWINGYCSRLNKILCERGCQCLNGGHCNATGSCLCPAGYTGVQCESSISFCASLPCLNGAICHENNTCQCLPGFNGTFCEQVFQCRLVNNPANGFFLFLDQESVNRRIGARMRLNCSKGYRPTTEYIVCEAGGWSDPQTTCKLTPCVLEASFLSDGVEVVGYDNVSLDEEWIPGGESITLQCFDPEKELIGVRKYHCGPEGLWNVHPNNASCHAPCPPLETPSNGRLEFLDYHENSTDRWKYGSRVRVVCAPGYETPAYNEIHCTDGWSQEIPSCQGRPCVFYYNDLSPDVDVVGVELQPNDEKLWKVGKSIELRCKNPSLQLAEGHPPTITCLPGMLWTFDYTWYECVERPSGENGYPLEDVGNCNIQSPHLRSERISHPSRRMFRFSCADGYVLVGRKRAACLDSGEWGRELPTCEAIPCTVQPGDLPDGVNVSENGQTFPPGAQIHLKCKDREAELSGDSTRICAIGGIWNLPFNTTSCPTHCNQLTNPTNGQIVCTSRTACPRIGTSVVVGCNRGYVASYGGEIICEGNPAAWNREIPTCEPIPCTVQPGDLPDGVNVSENGQTFPPGAQIHLKCKDREAELSGDSIRICTIGGIWNLPFNTTSCPAHCNRLTNTTNRQIVCRSGTACPRIGTSVVVECNGGYVASYDGEIVCEGNPAAWNREIPTCELIQCKIHPQDLSDDVGVFKYSKADLGNQRFHPGKRINLKCINEDLALVGKPDRICRLGGFWDTALNATSCQESPPVDSTDIPK